jgi:hypothetical protein
VRGARGRLAITLLAWHLLMPPLAYNTVTFQFVWVTDAPLVQWYHQGEFSTLGACHAARATRIVDEEQWLKDNGTKYDTDGFKRNSLEALRHARCFTDAEIK